LRCSTKSTKSFGENTTKRAIFFLAIFFWLIICSIAHGTVVLKVNDSDPAVSPLELKNPESLKITLTDSESSKTCYDLTLSALVGTFLYGDPNTSASSELVQNKKIDIQTSDLEKIGTLYFEFSDDSDSGAAVVSVTTNQPLTINDQIVPANTEIYQLVFFDISQEGKIIVFGVNYDSLNYTPPVQEEVAIQPLQAESLEAVESMESTEMALSGVSGGGSMMMSMSEPVWFDDPAQCPDLDEDNFVNFADFAIFAGNWLKTESGLAGDFNEDSIVDVNDLMHFSEFWLTEVYYPTYSTDPLPYTTSFEISQGYADAYYGYVDLDYQMGWQVNTGLAVLELWYALVGEYEMEYQDVIIDANSIVSKQFEDTGSDHEYIHLNFIPAVDQKINILNGSDVVASVWFADDWKIYVLDNGSYVNTDVDYESVRNSCRDYYFNSMDYENTFTDLKFKMNWQSNTYQVYWNGEPNAISNPAVFDQNYDVLTAFQTETGGDWGVLDSLTISDGMAEQPWVRIDSPCACDTDTELQGHVKIIGTAQGYHFGRYVLLYSPAELAFTSQGYIDEENWHPFASGTNMVENGVLGYWDTSSIPNGYYHLAVIVFDDLGYPQGYPQHYQVVFKTLSVGGTVVYEGPGYFPVVGDLKCNTFYHEEEPEISVPWAGQFPFEFRRVYNNNRRFYTQPLAPGWSHNSQIILTENCWYDWETRDSGPFLVPAYDDNFLGFGYIWIQYPDGSRQLFRNPNPEYEGSTVIYRPWPEDNTGEYIERTSYDDGFLTVTDIYYTLHTRDGIEMDFSVNDLSIPWNGFYGSINWEVQIGINSMSDRFGNTLTYEWRKADGKPVGVSRISDGNREIIFTFDSYNYYTKAELKVGSVAYRTVEFGFEGLYEGFNYVVTQKGTGVDEQGVYDPNNVKEYITKYQYDDGWNLLKIINVNNSSQEEALIEVDYDNYGRVWKRRDYVESDNFLETTYAYTFIDPNLPGEDGDRLITLQSNDARSLVTVQNAKGATLSQDIVPSDGCAVTQMTLVYEDSDNPLKPTDVYEYFDGLQRHTWNDYDDYGDLLEQQTFVDDSNSIATELTYHPDYAFETSRTSWQGLNKTGEKVQKLSIYGNADGTENENGDYLVAEMVLLHDGDPNDPNDNLWAVTNYTYYDTPNKKGLVKSITDPEEFVTLIEYDNNGYKTVVRKGTDPNSTEIVERYQYDAIGQLILQANPLGGVTRHDYDGFGRLYRTWKYEDLAIMYRSDPNSFQSPVLAETRFGYDEQGFKTFEKLDTSGEIDTSYTYNGLPIRKTFDDGSYVEFSYDTQGNKTQEYRYEYTSQKDWYVTFGYDSMNRLKETNWFDYDDATLIKRQISDYYGTGQKAYDEFFGYDGYPEKKVSYGYDILTRLTSTVTDPEGFALTVNYGYDAAGNRISTTDPKENIIYTDYDNANRRITEYFAATGGTEHEAAIPAKEIDYYNDSKVLSETRFDYNGSTVLAYSEFGYDARGRMIQTLQQIDVSNNAVTDYYYFDAIADPNEPNEPGILASIIIEDAEEKQTAITLDGFGRQLKRLYPSEDYEEYVYNGDGTLGQKAVWDDQSVKQWMDYYYDGYGRITDVNYPDTGYATFMYDGFGRKTLTIDGRNVVDNIGGSHQISYAFDVLNRVASYTDQDGYTVTYLYRHDGQKQSIMVEDPNHVKIYDVQHDFDTANRLYLVWDGFGNLLTDCIAHLEYDNNGNRQTLRYYPTGSFMGATVDMGYTYNRDNYLTTYTTSGGPTFTFDASGSGDIDGLGRLVNADETITPVGGSTVNHSYAYSYDMLSRLKYAYTSNVAPTAYREYDYEYDKAGNMTHAVFDNGGGFEHHTYYQLDGDQVTGTTGTGGTKYLTWDENGRQTSRYGNSAGDYPVGYNWDGKAISSNEHVDPNMGIEVKYTPDGVRIWKKFKWNLASYEHKYIVDTVGDVPQVLLIIDNDANDIIQTLVHANNQVIMQYDGDRTASRYFYLHDRLGSVRAIIDSSAAVQNCYYYTPWGSVTGSETEENVDNWYAWAGYWYEDGMENGLSAMYYCNARHYSSGRFLTRDPVRGAYNEPMTLHQYLYCLNNPINATDPSGEFGLGLWMRAKDASVKVGAKIWAMNKIQTLATIGNAIYSGYINTITGPDSMSDSAKFAIGFVAGAAEMQLGLKVNATTGAMAGSLITNIGNELLRDDRSASSLGWAAGDVIISTLLGRAADYLEPEGVQALEMFLLGFDCDWIYYDAQKLVEIFN